MLRAVGFGRSVFLGRFKSKTVRCAAFIESYSCRVSGEVWRDSGADMSQLGGVSSRYGAVAENREQRKVERK